MRLAVRIGIVASLAVASSRADAAPSARLVYARSTEAASCPAETSLRRAVAARFGYDPFFAWAKQTIVVQISREGPRFLARVQLVDEQGLARGTREIASEEASCAELFDATALAISIALDASSASSTSASPQAAASEASEPTAVAAPPAPEPSSPSSAPSVRDDATTAPAPTPPSAARVGVLAIASAFVTPSIAPGVAAFGEYRWPAALMQLELQASASLRANVDLSERDPSSAWIAAELLTVALAPCTRFGHAYACLVGDVGWLHAHSGGLAHPRSDDAPFVAAGGRLGAEWPLPGQYTFLVRADLLADLTPPRFLLDGQPWSAPVGAGSVGFGFGVPFL